MDVVEMYDVGFEIFQYSVETRFHVARSESAFQSRQLLSGTSAEADFGWPVGGPFAAVVLRIVHGEDSHLVSLLPEHLLKIQRIYAVTAATVVKFRNYQYSFFHGGKFKTISFC